MTAASKGVIYIIPKNKVLGLTTGFHRGKALQDYRAMLEKK